MGWMHSCLQAARLLSRSRDERLGPFEQVRLRLHLRLCANCAAVEKQLTQLDGLAGELLSGGFDAEAPGAAPADARPDALPPHR